jgi:hypothetical protein
MNMMDDGGCLVSTLATASAPVVPVSVQTGADTAGPPISAVALLLLDVVLLFLLLLLLLPLLPLLLLFVAVATTAPTYIQLPKHTYQTADRWSGREGAQAEGKNQGKEKMEVLTKRREGEDEDEEEAGAGGVLRASGADADGIEKKRWTR